MATRTMGRLRDEPLRLSDAPRLRDAVMREKL